jgi:hypothetical protein
MFTLGFAVNQVGETWLMVVIAMIAIVCLAMYLIDGFKHTWPIRTRLG